MSDEIVNGRECFGSRMGLEDFASEFCVIQEFIDFIHSDIDDIDDIEDYFQICGIARGFELLKPALLERVKTMECLMGTNRRALASLERLERMINEHAIILDFTLTSRYRLENDIIS